MRDINLCYCRKKNVKLWIFVSTIKGKYEPQKCGKVCCMMGACLLKTIVKREAWNCVHILWNKTLSKLLPSQNFQKIFVWLFEI